MSLVSTHHQHHPASSLTFRKSHLSHIAPTVITLLCATSQTHHLAVTITPPCGCGHMHEDAGARTSSQLHLRHSHSQTEAACIRSFGFFPLVLAFSQLHASGQKAESCSRCVVTCWLNTFQEELLKFKIYLRTMNVSEDFCSWKWQINNLEVILCTHWCMASLHCSHTLNGFLWNCRCFCCLPDFFLVFVFLFFLTPFFLCLFCLPPPLLACRGCF